jgi:hypothetical protein
VIEQNGDDVHDPLEVRTTLANVLARAGNGIRLNHHIEEDGPTVLIDRVFGDGHAAAHPELVVEVMNAASSDWAATRLAVASEGQGYAVDGSAAAALEEKT